jgi:hypothetical protein
MKLADLQAMGAFAPDELVKRDVAIKRPILDDAGAETGDYADESLTVHIRRGAAADAIEIMRAEAREQPFVAIYRSICQPDGTPVFESVEQAMRLQLWLAMPLFEAITEVAPKRPKASRKRTNGGAS